MIKGTKFDPQFDHLKRLKLAYKSFIENIYTEICNTTEQRRGEERQSHLPQHKHKLVGQLDQPESPKCNFNMYQSETEHVSWANPYQMI